VPIPFSKPSSRGAAHAALVALACAALFACASPRPTAAGGAPSIVDVRNQRTISEAQLVAVLAKARYRLLGEMHDNAAHHAIRARLVDAIATTGARPAVVFEQFDIEHDDALRGAQAAGADAEALASAGALDRKAWAWPLHKPILEAATARSLPVRAGNLSRALLRDASAGRTNDSPWQRRHDAARWTEAQASLLDSDIVDAHCGKLPQAVVPRLVRAQRLRDAAMAEALVAAATADGAILIAGNGHVRADVGVPVYLHDASTAGTVSVGFVESSGGETADVARVVAAMHPGLDYAWVTPPVVRDDPCAQLR
jgi:uncharacterized iron-regulated protein